MAWHGGTGTQGEPQTDCCADLTGNRCADDMENIEKQSKPCPSGKKHCDNKKQSNHKFTSRCGYVSTEVNGCQKSSPKCNLSHCERGVGASKHGGNILP